MVEAGKIVLSLRDLAFPSQQRKLQVVPHFPTKKNATKQAKREFHRASALPKWSIGVCVQRNIGRLIK